MGFEVLIDSTPGVDYKDIRTEVSLSENTIRFCQGDLSSLKLEFNSQLREHTILLNKERVLVNKGATRMNSLPLFPVVTSYATLQRNCYLQVLRNTAGP